MPGKKHYVRLMAICMILLTGLFACKKEKQVLTPVPFLTGRTWIADTITINPPVTYASLSTSDQQSYNASNGWFKLAKLTLNEDGTATCSGDYDLGYKSWRLLNNNADIEMTLQNGTVQVLRAWTADATHFTFVKEYKLSLSFDCTFNFE